MGERRLVALCAGGAACFVVGIGVAAVLYPGGTWLDPRAAGHSFAQNYLCDLMQRRALNGQPAGAGALAARGAVLAMLAAIAAFFALVARLEAPARRAGRVARTAGILAAVLGLALPFTPSDEVHAAHLVAVLAAFAPAMVAAGAALVVSLRAPGLSPWLRASALVAPVAGTLDGLAYGYAYAWAYGYVPGVRMDVVYAALPVLQRVATLGLLAWMAAVCAHHGRRAAPRPALGAECPRVEPAEVQPVPQRAPCGTPTPATPAAAAARRRVESPRGRQREG